MTDKFTRQPQHELPDGQAREQALQVDASFIVQAPAGSGKTELLIRRYLALLATVKAPEEVIAITFTLKAATEMRHRVLRAIKHAQCPPPESGYELQTWELAYSAWQNSITLNWQLEQSPSRLRILTIDALCLSLIRRMPRLSGFGHTPQISAEARPLYRAAARAVLQQLTVDGSEWGLEISTLLHHLDNQVNRAIDLLANMLQLRDQWLRHLGMHWDRAPDRRRVVLEQCWISQIEYDLCQITDSLTTEVRAQLTELAGYAASNLEDSAPESPIVSWRDARTFPAASVDDLPRWRGLAELLLTKGGSIRKTVNAAQGFPPGTSNNMKQHMRDLLTQLTGNECLSNILEQIAKLPEAGFDERQWQIVSALTSVLPLAAAQLNVIFAQADQVDFTEISISANRALGALHAPSDLALRLDYQISHLLVDEFQDTSLSQFDLIQSLTAGWADGDGRTLFLVGDPMQSIYRFREAEVGLFTQIRSNGLSNIQLTPLTLVTNFRSDSKLVNWVNDTFSPCFPARSNPGLGAVGYTPSVAMFNGAKDAAVELHGFIRGHRSTESKRITELVSVAWQRNPEEKIAILVRTRQSLRDILPELNAAGIAYSGTDIQQLDWQPVVQDLMALTRALCFPADRTAWFSVLRAPWCGLTLADLHHLAADMTTACLWDCLHEPQRIEGLSPDARARLDRFIPPIGRALAQRRRLGLDRALENLWIELGGPACAEVGATDNARLYFDVLHDYLRRRGSTDLSGLATEVAQTWAHTKAQGQPSVEIMTLHKAKGLEFDMVILPSLEKQPRSGDTSLLRWEEQLYGSRGALLIAPSAPIGRDPDPHYQYLKRIHQDKDHFEVLRLLYVGCTRARRTLHLLATLSIDSGGVVRPPAKHSLLGKLWSELASDFESSLSDDGPMEPVAQSGVAGLRRLPLEWQLPALPEAVNVNYSMERQTPEDSVEFSWAGELARQTGIIVHDILERMGEEGLDDWSADRLRTLRPLWSIELQHQGIVAEAADRASLDLYSRLISMLGDERLKWLMSDEHSAVVNEYAISTVSAQGVKEYRIDRTFIDGTDTRWIVDFKSSTHFGGGRTGFLDREQQRYRPQLESYAAALQEMDGRRIRLGLYFPMMQGWREWEFNNGDVMHR